MVKKAMVPAARTHGLLVMVFRIWSNITNPFRNLVITVRGVGFVLKSLRQVRVPLFAQCQYLHRFAQLHDLLMNSAMHVNRDENLIAATGFCLPRS